MSVAYRILHFQCTVDVASNLTPTDIVEDISIDQPATISVAAAPFHLFFSFNTKYQILEASLNHIARSFDLASRFSKKHG